jgi:hypothetical protein
LRDIGDARVEIEDLVSDRAPGGALTDIPLGGSSARDRLPWAIAAGAVLALLGMTSGASWLRWGRQSAMPAKMAFDIVTDSSPAPNQLALSPDGTRLVAIISTPTRGFALWLRRIDEAREQS